MKRRIIYIAVCLLVMIPAALSYAGGGLLSGFPGSAAAGDTITFSPALEDGESGSLEASVSPSQGADLSVSGDSIKVTFSEAGTYTISASAGDRSDSCSITVSGDTSEDTGSEDAGGADAGDTGGASTEDGESADNTGGESADAGSGSEKTSGDASAAESDNAPSQNQKQNQEQKTGKSAAQPSGGMQKQVGSGKASVSGGGSGAGGSGGSSSEEDKTTYTGSADNYLESLKVKGHKFSQAFHKTNDTYFVTADSETDSVTVTAVPSDEEAEVVVTGAEDLSVGRNKVMVSVTAENGAVRVYRIYVDIK